MDRFSNEVIADSKQPKMDWAQFQLLATINIHEARSGGDITTFQRSVNSLDTILSGWKDDTHAEEMAILENKKQNLLEDNDAEETNILYYDEKMRILSNLIYRINRGMQRVRQNLETSHLITDIAKKLTDGIGQNIFLTGKPGSGKSYTAISVAQKVTDKTGGKFDVNKHVAFTPQEFIEIYNDEKLTPPGSCIVFDEAGVTYNSKDHYNDANKQFSKLLQTIRHRAVCVILTAPDLGMVEKDGRKLLHFWLKTERIEKKRGICTIKPFCVELSQRDGKILYPYPVYDGQQLTLIEVSKIKDKTATVYEEKAKRYKDDLALQTELSLKILKDDKVLRLREFAKLRSEGKTIKAASEIMNINPNTGGSLEKMRRRVNLT